MIDKFQTQYSKIEKWVRSNRWEAFWLVMILLLGAILRLYRIDEYMTFLGDEGRDAIIVRRLLVDFDPILIGPGTSIGNMYLGPLYYYMMAPFLLISNFSPAGPAIGVALLAIVTVWLVWYVGRMWFGRFPAILSAFLYAISPAVIVYSRSSWNPNIMPFFSLLLIYSVWKFWSKREYRWIVIALVCSAAVLQSHYLGLILIPIVGLFWVISLVNEIRKPKIENPKSKSFIKFSALGGLFFILLMSPLFMFDMRHGWMNFRSIEKFFTERQTTVSAKPWNAFANLDHVVERISQALINPDSLAAPRILSAIFVFVSFWLLVKLLIRKNKGRINLDIKGFWSRFNSKELSPFILIVVWLGVSVIGLGVYKQEIYAHYFGFFYAGAFLMLGASVAIIRDIRWRLGTLISFLIVGFIALTQLQASPLQYPPSNQLGRTIEVADKMIEISGGDLFNIAVIAERNYEGAYQYFLERENANFVIIDPERLEETIAPQLLVVCELPKDKCDPTHNDKAEVANFGWSKIAEEHEVAGVIVFKLVHTK